MAEKDGRENEETIGPDLIKADNNDGSAVTIATAESSADDPPPPMIMHLLLDAGYGIPRESRPRQEKILAMAKQIANFLEWQQEQLLESSKSETEITVASPVTVIGCKDDDMKVALLQRLERLMEASNKSKAATPSNTTNNAETNEEKLDSDPEPTNNSSNDSDDNNSNSQQPPSILPHHFSFARDEEHSKALLKDAVYLSPDAPLSLNPSQPPPAKVIVGLLIDRRVQVNRSLIRSDELGLEAKRWPMEVLELDENGNEYLDSYHSNEPLNVDSIMEALQQWSWNSSSSSTEAATVTNDDAAFRQASLQAFRHHAQRHPARTKHR